MEIQKIGLKNDVLKAMETILKNNKDNERLQYVFIDNENVFVTCGRTALIVKNEGLKAGSWTIIGKEKGKYISFLIVELAENIQAPDITKVFPVNNNEKKTIYISDALSISSAVINLYQWIESAFNYEYFEYIAPLKENWTISKQDKDKAIIDEINFLLEVMPYEEMVGNFKKAIDKANAMQTPWFTAEYIWEYCKDDILEILKGYDFLENGEYFIN